ncbi:patatin-like phospholipase family protein [Aneurinibacillus aneurinilyticus]|uniref:Phospholipase, patatin family n=1 Tax=Aneurinibacillus aneurinilyticus ATCC 12856 TaxID=649747 RepID=U1YHX8_ANEAE|nr:patatin-like phospholipase family protein [Aneurinibacillus aneurinilyticus]ERI11707.1 phospholipase, patatin family [Aneurinibacillus aneurinilyticus ATCC 12856]MED0708836.1 patatin-like phospholipase family protein [Aneurinibacillus aneurinilyticus]MED0726110.1 patatin-like phospholipase family protein [Aneurinibacillus aneurinilyticus]MED0741086.1 patatin-like phospholipase family protein [Aneurinibacillus aneurinilyticus]
MGQEIRLNFSGGGFRATFYCLGGYRRLVELGVHSYVTQLSSVSGGSIAAGAIMQGLTEGDFKDLRDFDHKVTTPLRRLGKINVRKILVKQAYAPRLSNLKQLFKLRTRFSRLFPILLDKELFNNQYICELPTKPEWSCNTTCLNTMKRLRFKVVDCYGNLLGTTTDISDIKISLAVAASAAFPLMFAPIKVNTKGREFYDKYNSSVYSTIPETLYLTDGGVYDNLGSESILKENGHFITMDASAGEECWTPDYNMSFSSGIWRLLNVSMNQIVNLRRRLLYLHSGSEGIQLLIGHPIAELRTNEVKIREHERSLPVYSSDYQEIERLVATLRTDLDSFKDIEMDTLMWSGAVRMDLAVKSLFPEIISEEKWLDTPKFPNYTYDEIIQTLKLGQTLKVF